MAASCQFYLKVVGVCENAVRKMNISVPIRASKDVNHLSLIAGAAGLLDSEAYIHNIEALRHVWMSD